MYSEQRGPVVPHTVEAEHHWASLMARAQDGDADAYVALLDDVAPYLRTAIGRGWPDGRDIESAVQDVLLTMHALRHTYDPSRPFAPWLLDIANRRAPCRPRPHRRIRDGKLGLDHRIAAVAMSLLTGLKTMACRSLNSCGRFRRLIRVAAGGD